MKAALYIRVSTSEQALHGYSLAAQEMLLREYAASHDMEVYKVYADEGISASKTFSKRKALLQMLDDAEQGKFGCILFKDITRWSRSSKNYWAIQDRLDKCKVGWISVQQPFLGTMDPTTRFQTNIMLSTSQLESEQTGERIKFVQDSLVKRGFYPFGSICCPIGYKLLGRPAKLVPDPEGSETVREYFDYYVTHGSLKGLEEHFNLKPHTVEFILRNRIYIGEFRGVADFCEPIIDRETFDTAQALIRGSLMPQKNRGKYIFSSLGVCADDGTRICASKNGDKVYYNCPKCGKKCIPEWRLEKEFISAVDEYMHDAVIKANAQPKQRNVEGKRMKLLAKIDRLNDLYVDGEISRADYNEKKASLEAQISALTDKTIKPLKGFTGGWKEAYSALEPQKKNVLWRTVVERFEIDRDKTVSIFFRKN